MRSTSVVKGFCAPNAKDSTPPMLQALCMARRKRKVGERPTPAHRLAAWRRHRDYSQEELADRAGTSHSTISRLESGSIKLTEDTLVRLATALRIEPADLYRDPLDPIWSLVSMARRLPLERIRLLLSMAETLDRADTAES